MLIYWLMFCIPALFALIEQNHEVGKNRLTFVWVVTTILIAVIIGFRWKTGGDWGNYYKDIDGMNWEAWSLTMHRDIGYGQLAWLASHTGNGMLLIQLFSGVLMATALTRFSLAQPRPWLCLTVAVPYLIMVLGMGYMRQGIAVSFFLIGVLALREGRVVRYSLWSALGATFHSTGVILFPIGAIVSTRNRILTFFFGSIASVLVFVQLLEPKTEQFVGGYVTEQMDSQGALVRLVMTGLPAILFLIFRKNFRLGKVERNIWTIMSGAAVALLLAFFVSPSSTVVDRIGLYFIPVQCFVSARMPDAFGKSDQARRIIAVMIILLYAIAFFTWLYFSTHAYLWLPYRFWFFEDGLCTECRDV